MIRRIDNQRYVRVQRPGYIDRVKAAFRTLPLEKETEENLIKALKQYGFTDIGQQKKCSGGKIDIIAGALCIEVKRELTNSSIKGALGQVILYSQLTNKQPALAGYPGNCNDELIKEIRDMGCHLFIKEGIDWVWFPPVN
ncbi:MAG: hypothetical protein R3321_00210 [Nitrososphaeraceae archaeon]|nr:hypothetical protein [Nitrososphaeraceae archaeon]